MRCATHHSRKPHPPSPPARCTLPQGLPAELSLEQACSPACSELVGRMKEMLGTLLSLSHLDDAGPQQVGSENGTLTGSCQGTQAAAVHEAWAAHVPVQVITARTSSCPQDASLAWLAANFMEQRHPLVAAMRAQGGPAWCSCGC